MNKSSFTMPSLPVQLFVLLGCVAIVFLPSLFAEYSTIDDMEVIPALAALKDFSVSNVLFPASGGYYRPLLHSSQLVDRFVWNLSSPVVHAENIFLHGGNAVWVYFIARQLIPGEQRPVSAVPLTASLLFAVHPIVTESVNWFSGRTDLLAAFFGFPAIYAVCAWKAAGKRGLLLPLTALICAIIGVLSKEAVLGLFLVCPLLIASTGQVRLAALAARWKIIVPLAVCSLLIGLFYYTFWPSLLLAVVCLAVMANNTGGDDEADRQWWHIDPRLLFWLLLAGSAITLLSYGLRKLVFIKQSSIFWHTAVHIAQNPEYAAGQFMGAIAFYLKKFFIPLPLNFAIREIDPLYQLAGIVILFLSVLLLLKRDRASFVFLAGIIALAPALPFVFGIIAWTSFAERYMYLSTGLWAIAVALAIESVRWRRSALGLLICVIMVFAVITFKRNVLWQSDESLIADTVEKSPRFKMIRGKYLALLYENGRYEEAARQYQIAVTLPDVGYNPEYDLMYVQILHKMGDKDKAREVLNTVERKSEKSSDKVRQMRTTLKL